MKLDIFFSNIKSTSYQFFFFKLISHQRPSRNQIYFLNEEGYYWASFVRLIILLKPRQLSKAKYCQKYQRALGKSKKKKKFAKRVLIQASIFSPGFRSGIISGPLAKYIPDWKGNRHHILVECLSYICFHATGSIQIKICFFSKKKKRQFLFSKRCLPCTRPNNHLRKRIDISMFPCYLLLQMKIISSHNMPCEVSLI